MPKHGPKVHVVPSQTTPGKFVNKVEGKRTPISRPASQAKSIAKAIPVAKKNHSEVVIHRPNGQIRDSDSYGDESKVIDKKH